MSATRHLRVHQAAGASTLYLIGIVTDDGTLYRLAGPWTCVHAARRALMRWRRGHPLAEVLIERRFVGRVA